jgi:hypothetical protein
MPEIASSPPKKPATPEESRVNGSSCSGAMSLRGAIFYGRGAAPLALKLRLLKLEDLTDIREMAVRLSQSEGPDRSKINNS